MLAAPAEVPRSRDKGWCPRWESNPDWSFRKRQFYPLNYRDGQQPEAAHTSPPDKSGSGAPVTDYRRVLSGARVWSGRVPTGFGESGDEETDAAGAVSRHAGGAMENTESTSFPKLGFTRVEAAKILGISAATLDRLVCRRLLFPSRATSRPLFPLWELERFLRETQEIA